MNVISPVSARTVGKDDDALLGLSLRRTTSGHIDTVVKLINNEHKRTGSVLTVQEREVREWADKGHSMVAMVDGTVVGHQAVYVWPKSEWVEFRSAVVIEGFRGHNINCKLKRAFLEDFAANKPEVSTFVALKNGASSGMKILESLGFIHITASEAPGELFTIGEGQNWSVLKLDLSRYRRV